MTNVITIYDQADDHAMALFQAPANEYAAKALFNFLVENLRPGLAVGLDAGGERWKYPTGAQLQPAEYAALNDGAND